MIPASNMKIVTLAATAERLGWDYRYETDLLTAAPIESGILQGDLIVRGSGDPTINRRHSEPAVFDTWADELKCLGVRVIDGRIIGDDNAFDEDDLGAGWAWDYLAYGYATPGGALQYNENIVSLRIQPGEAIGDPVAIDIQPLGSGVQLNIRAVTRPADEDLRVTLRRLPDQPVLDVIGVVPIGIEPFVRTASVHNPTEFFVRTFRAALMSSGIDVRGDAIDVDALPGADWTSNDESTSPLRSLYTHHSPPLSDAGTVLMKVSQNLYAETFLETLGGQGKRGTAEAGRDIVRSVLISWGISPDEYVQYDGSGLSRYNYVTADMLIRILTRMHRDPNHATAFKATLPIAGRDGTLEHRMIGTRAEGNARAKTGSISNVRALSGYVNTSDDDPLAFSIIANHFHLPQSAIDAVADLAVERLAHFTGARPANSHDLLRWHREVAGPACGVSDVSWVICSARRLEQFGLLTHQTAALRKTRTGVRNMGPAAGRQIEPVNVNHTQHACSCGFLSERQRRALVGIRKLDRHRAVLPHDPVGLGFGRRNGFSRELDGEIDRRRGVSKVKADRARLVKMIACRRQDVLSAVLLHVVETARPVDVAPHSLSDRR